MKNILIIEDDRALAQGISIALAGDGISLESCHAIESARRLIAESSFDLFILDLNLPDGNGLSFLPEIKNNCGAPIIILTANDMETDIVTGLESGADDYITKPFSLAVLRARVNTQLRKTNLLTVNRLEIDEFVFDFDRLEYFKGSQSLELSKTEQKLLRMLIENRGITLERAVLVDRIWTDGAEYVDENALSVTIKRLRDKLEDSPSKPHYIKTVYGIGYSWSVK